MLRIKYKGFSPERPLSNVFTSYRSIFTPIQKVSLALYDLSWDSQARPQSSKVDLKMALHIFHIIFLKYFSENQIT